jgi:hypothetical protein
MSSNDEIRISILQHLYTLYYRDPKLIGISRAEMLELLNTQENLMDSNMLYLEQKDLVKLLKTMGSLWELASITAFGIDVIENKETYKQQFPFVTVQVQEIYGNVHGNVVQAKDSHVTIHQIDNVFQKAYSMTESRAGISPDLKKEILSNLTSLEEEMKKREPDTGKIQKTWNWLKRNANWVVPVLTQIVLEVVKVALSGS